jgi:hypothetical protein
MSVASAVAALAPPVRRCGLLDPDVPGVTGCSGLWRP